MSSNTPTPPPTDSYKRKFEVLQAQLAASNNSGPAARSASAHQVYLGRGLRRTVDMFHSARELVDENDRRTDLIASGEDSELNAEDEHMARSYNELVKRMPVVKTLTEQGDTDALENLYRNLRKGSDMARGDDAGSLKSAVVTWVNESFGPSVPALKTNSKDERGLESDHTGRLLCPGEFDWDDLVIRNNIREGHGDFLVTAQSWPLFLYARYTCDLTDIEAGLFRSPILLKAFKYIFTSPNSAANMDEESGDDPRPTKRARKSMSATRSNVATLIGLQSVTGRSIAYVAVQLRFACSNAGAWRVTDVDFSYDEFYTAIVDYFEVTPGPMAQACVDDLLAWWNRKVFGRTTGTPNAPRHHNGNSVLKLAAQRKAREVGSSAVGV